MARRKSATKAAQRPDIRSRVAELINHLAGMEDGGFRLPYRDTLDAIERGEDVTVYGWQVTDVVPAVDRDGRYILHSDNTLTPTSD